MVDEWRRNILRWLFPSSCLLCGDQGLEDLALCRGCRDDLRRPTASCQHCALPLPAAGICGRCQRRPPGYQRARAPYLYAPPLDSLLLQLKFGSRLAVAPLLGVLLARALAPVERELLLVPVPLHRRRLAERGFNQVWEIGRVLARELDLPSAPAALRRVRHTPPQSTVDAGARRRLLRGVFRAEAGLVAGRRIALLDDVMTTGATLEEAAAELLRGGAAAVEVWSVARTAGGAKAAV